MKIEDLAIMIQKSLYGMESRLASKEEMNDLREDLNSLRDEMHVRFDRVENKLFRGHDERIEKLEDKMLQVQVVLGKKFA